MAQKIISRIVPPRFYDNRKRFIIRWYEDEKHRQKSFEEAKEAQEYYQLLISQILPIQTESAAQEKSQSARGNKLSTKSIQSVHIGGRNKLAKDIKRLQGNEVAEYLPKLPPYNSGSSKFFKTAMHDSLVAANRATNSRDSAALTCIQKYAGILNSTSNAMLPHKKLEELEDQLEQANKKIKEMRRMKVKENASQHAASGPTHSGVKETIRSSELLLRSSNPVQD
jgi:hypothetical protein